MHKVPDYCPIIAIHAGQVNLLWREPVTAGAITACGGIGSSGINLQ